MKNKLSYFYKVLILFLITVLSTSCILTVFSARQLSDSLKSKAWADYQSGQLLKEEPVEELLNDSNILRAAVALARETEVSESVRRSLAASKAPSGSKSGPLLS